MLGALAEDARVRCLAGGAGAPSFDSVTRLDNAARRAARDLAVAVEARPKRSELQALVDEVIG